MNEQKIEKTITISKVVRIKDKQMNSDLKINAPNIDLDELLGVLDRARRIIMKKIEQGYKIQENIEESVEVNKKGVDYFG